MEYPKSPRLKRTRMEPETIRRAIHETGLTHKEIYIRLGINAFTAPAQWIKLGKIALIHYEKIMEIGKMRQAQLESVNKIETVNFCPCCGFNLKKIAA